MTNMNDLNKYKKAKIVVKELDAALKVVNLAIRGLVPFKKYASLTETVLSLKDSRDILEIHLEHQKKILETKGQIE